MKILRNIYKHIGFITFCSIVIYLIIAVISIYFKINNNILGFVTSVFVIIILISICKSIKEQYNRTSVNIVKKSFKKEYKEFKNQVEYDDFYEYLKGKYNFY